MSLSNKNYYSQNTNFEYLSFSQYKDFCGGLGKAGCEAMAIAKLKGEWKLKKTTAMLVGGYVDAYFEGAESLEKFKLENPEIFKKDGKLNCKFVEAENIIKRIEKDRLFMKYLSGKKQPIFTAEFFGAKWKGKLDVLHRGKAIVDLKIIKNIREAIYVKGYGKMNFVEYWGYDLQLAIYQKLVELNTGEKLPCYIAVADKGEFPDIEIIGIDQTSLDSALIEIESNVSRILKLKTGEQEADRCEVCDYCKSTKILTEPIHYRDLILA